MGNPANDVSVPSQISPARHAAVGLAVRDLLAVPVLAGARIVAGAAGAGRVVERVNVMEVPDILPWVKPNELLLTTGYPLRHAAMPFAELVAGLDAAGLAALAVKPHRYLDDLPADLLAAAEARGFPVIELPPDAAFDDILNEVLSDVLDRQAAVLARADRVHHALVQIALDGGELGDLAGELARILGGPVLATTPDGRILAEAGEAQALAAVTGCECFDAGRRLRTESEPAGLTEHHGVQHALVPIVAGRVDHGRLAAFAGRRAFDAADVAALERAATVAALAVVKQLAVSAVEDRYRADFLRDLLTGRSEDPGSAVAHCASLGWDIATGPAADPGAGSGLGAGAGTGPGAGFGTGLGAVRTSGPAPAPGSRPPANRGPLLVVVAEIDPGQSVVPASRHELRPAGERFAAAWQTVVAAHDRTAPVAGFHREVVAVLRAPTAPGGVDRLVRGLVGEVSGTGGGGRRTFSTGISRPVRAVEDLPAAYDQARRAVRMGRKLNGPASMAHFDELGVYRLLALVPDPEELRAFARETLRDLAEVGDPDADDLRATLEVLLDTNLNVAEAARRLHFHYNTLRYRIGKIERLVGPFMERADLRLDLSVALRVLHMRGL
jgi:PucR family transcriptional regulator, purine catabolism regulatory protein